MPGGGGGKPGGGRMNELIVDVGGGDVKVWSITNNDKFPSFNFNLRASRGSKCD
jgi:activator of 2-hydroxyglutaryl-CoA dehydratase